MFPTKRHYVKSLCVEYSLFPLRTERTELLTRLQADDVLKETRRLNTYKAKMMFVRETVRKYIYSRAIETARSSK